MTLNNDGSFHPVSDSNAKNAIIGVDRPLPRNVKFSFQYSLGANLSTVLVSEVYNERDKTYKRDFEEYLEHNWSTTGGSFVSNPNSNLVNKLKEQLNAFHNNYELIGVYVDRKSEIFKFFRKESTIRYCKIWAQVSTYITLNFKLNSNYFVILV